MFGNPSLNSFITVSTFSRFDGANPLRAGFNPRSEAGDDGDEQQQGNHADGHKHGEPAPRRFGIGFTGQSEAVTVTDVFTAAAADHGLLLYFTSTMSAEHGSFSLKGLRDPWPLKGPA